jgi:hypothetical protein
MIKELSQYENLGTPHFFYELFQQLVVPSEEWTYKNIREYFYNRIVDGYYIFDGCIPLIETIGAVVINDNEVIKINPIIRNHLEDEKIFSRKLLEMILSTAKNDEIFQNIFCTENLSYDTVNRLVQIDNSAFELRYANFRQLLINFYFLQYNINSNIKKLVINPNIRDLFDEELLPFLKRGKIGLSQLKKNLEQNNIYGEQAESFVLEFEKSRLSSHIKVENIEIISEYDVAAGYDIVSYENNDSIQFDRFIEVKSFSGDVSFHWSRNEIDTARIKKDSYFLYLVNREMTFIDGYSPLIIQNPYEKIIENSNVWSKTIEGYFVTKN